MSAPRKSGTASTTGAPSGKDRPALQIYAPVSPLCSSQSSTARCTPEPASPPTARAERNRKNGLAGRPVNVESSSMQNLCRSCNPHSGNTTPPLPVHARRSSTPTARTSPDRLPSSANCNPMHRSKAAPASALPDVTLLSVPATATNPQFRQAA